MSSSGSESAAAKLALAVRSLRENMPAMLEYSVLHAAILRARYETLLDKGFTEAQALHLCTQKFEV